MNQNDGTPNVLILFVAYVAQPKKIGWPITRGMVTCFYARLLGVLLDNPSTTVPSRYDQKR